ncbi:MAG: hypothetical protein LN560_04690 [Rickettsia endosymbiont of Sceptobius lativentris]|nr:hypothetical protein [Rickettsia endosymbiont of Sceptobius lativentris]
MKEIRKAAELFKNFDITKSLNFYGNLATKYEAVVNEFFNSNSFNTEKPEKGIQPNAMKNFLNLTGISILKVVSSYSETDEVELLEVIQSALENDHKFKNAVSKIVGIHVGRNIPSELYQPVAEELISNVDEGNKLVTEILNIVGKHFVSAEKKQYDELKEKYNIESFESHKIKIEIESADKNTAKIKFYRQNEQKVIPHKHGQVITVKVGEKYSEFTVIKTGHDEEGYYYECLIKKNPNGTVTNYLFDSENQLVKVHPSYIESGIENNKDLVLISGGSGESHSISRINSITNEENVKLSAVIHIIHSTKNKNSDTFQLDAAVKKLTDIAAICDTEIHYDKFYTQDSYNNINENDNIHYHTGRIAEEFLLGMLKGKTYEICGPHSFNNHVQHILEEKMGVMYTQIHIEEFCSSGGDYDPSLSGQEGLSSICPFINM